MPVYTTGHFTNNSEIARLKFPWTKYLWTSVSGGDISWTILGQTVSPNLSDVLRQS